MGKTWHSVFPAKSLIEQHMQGSTWQPLLTTNHVGNLHQMVVHDVGKMICWQLVCALIEHLVVQDITHHLHVSSYHIVDMNLLSWFNLETNCILLTICDELIYLLLGKGERVAHLHTGMGIVLEILNLSTLSFQLLGSIESDISLTRIEQLLHIFLIDVATLTLAVRTMLSTKAYTLVKLDTEPFE